MILNNAKKNRAAIMPWWTQIQAACFILDLDPPTLEGPLPRGKITLSEWGELFYADDGNLNPLGRVFHELGEAVANGELEVETVDLSKDWRATIEKAKAEGKLDDDFFVGGPHLEMRFSPKKTMEWALRKGYEVPDTYMRILGLSTESNSESGQTQLLTQAEVARLLQQKKGVPVREAGRQRVSEAVKTGKLPSTELEGKKRIKQGDALVWIEKQPPYQPHDPDNSFL